MACLCPPGDVWTRNGLDPGVHDSVSYAAGLSSHVLVPVPYTLGVFIGVNKETKYFSCIIKSSVIPQRKTLSSLVYSHHTETTACATLTIRRDNQNLCFAGNGRPSLCSGGKASPVSYCTSFLLCAGDSETACSGVRAKYEELCPATWVKHFDRKRQYEAYKEKLKVGYDPVDHIKQKAA